MNMMEEHLFGVRPSRALRRRSLPSVRTFRCATLHLCCSARGRCTLHASLQSACADESQRDSAAKPWVASSELPWVTIHTHALNSEGVAPIDQKPACRGTYRAVPTKRRNLFEVDGSMLNFPRVARSSQPWAGGHNPFGIETACKVQRGRAHSE